MCKIGEVYMRKRFANSANNGVNLFYQKRIEKDYFCGYACYLKMKNVINPLKVNDGEFQACLLDENYEWLELYPDNENYAITIMFDDNNNLIEYYFDIAREVGILNGIPYEDDLYLDMLIKPDGSYLVLDEEELIDAYNSLDITKEELDMAYNILEKLKEKYVNNFEELIKLTDLIYREFVNKDKSL